MTGPHLRTIKKTRLAAGVTLIVTAVGLFVLAAITFVAPADAANTDSFSAQATEKNTELIKVLGYEIERDRIAIPTDWDEVLVKDMKVQVAYNDTDVVFRAQFPSPYPGFIHDVLRFENGAWKAYGSSLVGQVPYGLYEDRFTFHVDDGSVRGFEQQGCGVACHLDLRYPFTYAAPTKDEVAQNAYFTDVIKKTDTRHYIPESRNPGEDWWDVNWDDINADDAGRIADLKEAGVFLDQWHWRAARGGPIGQSDDMWVLDYRNGDAGNSPYTTNLDSSTGLPKKMFDPDKVGISSMNWSDIEGFVRDPDSPYYLADNTMKDFDPNHGWKEGDVLPNKVLRTGTDSRGDIKSISSWNDGWWTVELRRELDTGNADDKAFDPARYYNLAFAFYTAGTGNRFHYVTFPKTLAFNRPADMIAKKFEGTTPDWGQVPEAEFTAYYPGQATWQFLTSDEHPGAPAIRDNSRSCSTCHTEKQLAKLAVGLELRSEREAGRASTWVAGLLGITAMAGAGWVLRRA